MRRNISILITELKLCRVPAICNRIHGSVNSPPVHSWSPVLVHQEQLRHLFVFEASIVPLKLETEKTGTLNHTVENSLLPGI